MEIISKSYLFLFAGYNNKQMQEALLPVLRLSEAGNLDMARTSDLVTDSLSSLGKSTKDLPVYLDQVAKTAASSNTNIDALMEGLIVCGGTIKNLNVPLDEANSLMGVLANRGIKGSEAGNSLNSILINLTSGAGQAGDAMEALGLSAFDSKGKFKGVTTVLQELKKKLGRLSSDKDKNKILAMIGGKTQIDTLQALLSGVGEEYSDLRNKVKDSNGALNDMATTMQKNNKGSLTQLKSAVEELGLKIYDVLKPVIAEVINKFQWFTNVLNKLSPETQHLIIKIAMLAAVIGPVLLILGGLTIHVSKIIKKFNSFCRVIKNAGRVMAFLSSPGMIALAVIAALIVGAILIATHWKEVSNCFKWVAKKISDFTGITKTKIKAVLKIFKRFANIIKTKVVDAFKKLVSKVGPHLKKFIDTVKKIFKQIKPILLPILAFLGGTFVVSIMAAFSIISNAIATAVNVIGGIISGLLDIFGGILDFIVGVFTGNWSQAWEGIKSIFSGVCGILSSLWEGIISLLTAPVQAIIDILDSVFHDKITKIKAAWEGIKTFISHPIQGIVSLVKHGDLSGVGKNALGTSYWGGGYSLVGEHGPEIVELPNGSKVNDANNSKKMLSNNGQGNGVVINISNMNVRQESDIDSIANALATKIRLEMLNMA